MTADVLLSFADVMDRTTLTRIELHQLLREGAFVEPIEVAPNEWVWRESDVDDWIEARPAADAMAIGAAFHDEIFQIPISGQKGHVTSAVDPKARAILTASALGSTRRLWGDPRSETPQPQDTPVAETADASHPVGFRRH
jgi:predicted DNA-binding transcriptional regulator AlpA